MFLQIVGNQSTGNWANWHSYFEKQFDILSNNRAVKTTWLSNFTTRSIALEKLLQTSPGGKMKEWHKIALVQ